MNQPLVSVIVYIADILQFRAWGHFSCQGFSGNHTRSCGHGSFFRGSGTKFRSGRIMWFVARVPFSWLQLITTVACATRLLWDVGKSGVRLCVFLEVILLVVSRE